MLNKISSDKEVDLLATDTKKKQEDNRIQIKPSVWNRLAGLQQPNIIRAFDGINVMNPFSIKDSYASSMKNLSIDHYPSLSTRMGYIQIKNKLWDDNVPVNALYVFEYSGSSYDLHVLIKKSWYRYNFDTNFWELLNDTMLPDDETIKWDITTFVVDENTKYMILSAKDQDVLKYCNSQVTKLDGAPKGLCSITNHDNRLYGALKNTVYYSALRKPEDWKTVNDSGSIVVETTNGETINKLIASSGRLTIFKSNSIHELYGTNPANYQLKVVTEDLGSPYGNSIQTIDGILYFVSYQSIYRYTGGVNPKNDFSLPVNNLIKRINQNVKDKIYSWSSEHRYYVALPLDDSTEANTILEYDSTFNTWTVWTLPSSFSCLPRIYNNEVYFANIKGEIMKFDKDATLDDTTAIEWEWISKPFTVTSIAEKMTWYKMWVVADIDQDATLNAAVSTTVDGDDWTVFQTINARSDITTKEIIIPHDLIYNKNLVRIRLFGKGKVTIYEVSRQERAMAFGYQ